MAAISHGADWDFDLLERYDADGLTIRRGDERFIRRKRG